MRGTGVKPGGNAGSVTIVTPFVEGLVDSGRTVPMLLSAGGRQVVAGDFDAVQVACWGRVHFRSTDLQVIADSEGVARALATAWQRHGTDMTNHFGGEFVVAIWCARTRSGLFAVDRFSTFSLFWAENGGRLAVATRPGRVCELLQLPFEVEPRSLHAYAYFHVIPAPLSIARGVQRLDMGQALVVDGGTSRVIAHWTPSFVEDSPWEFVRERDAFRGALRQGVRECIGSTPRERLGCFLSGGTDSSTIAGLVTEAYGSPARTFSIGFDVSGYDERQWSRIAARHFGTEHTEHVLTPSEAHRAIEAIAIHYEQPFGNSSALPTFVCASLAREAGIDRLLGGDGGDELYGGNERYAKQWLFSLYEGLPAGARRGLIEPLLFGPLAETQWWPVRKVRGYVEQARVDLPDRLGSKYNLLNRFGVQRVFTDAVLDAERDFNPSRIEEAVWARCTARSQVNRLLAYDFKFTLGDNDLPKVTRMCHAAGVEVAFPMLCDSVVDHSLRTPPGQKLKRTRLRYFFKEALRGFLPDEIIEKPKHGFGMPFGDWLLGQPGLAGLAQDALAGLASRGVVREAFVGELRHALQSGHAGYYGTMIWVLMILELWMREHADARLGAPQPA